MFTYRKHFVSVNVSFDHLITHWGWSVNEVEKAADVHNNKLKMCLSRCLQLSVQQLTSGLLRYASHQVNWTLTVNHWWTYWRGAALNPLTPTVPIWVQL